ncbi:MAG: hypothetical protein MRZ52_09435 [Oscillospiraceae bacterium]|nr:hypothetical protein [Oscillospiraceae bacterium]
MNARQREAIILAGGVLLGVSVIFNAVLLGRTAKMARNINDLTHLAEQQDLRYTTLNDKLDDLSDQVQESGSLLSHSSVEVGVSAQGHLLISVQITPKSLRAGDSVSVSIGNVSAEAVKEGGSYQAELELPAYSGNLSPVVTIAGEDGSREYETLSGISTDDYLQLYYSFDLSRSRNGIDVNVGFQPEGNCVLTFPDHLKNIWLETTINEESDPEITYMTFSGNRIPEASGAVSSTEAASNSSADLYYTYYSAVLAVEKNQKPFMLRCRMVTDGGLTYLIDIGQIDPAEKFSVTSGDGSLSPEDP